MSKKIIEAFAASHGVQYKAGTCGRGPCVGFTKFGRNWVSINPYNMTTLEEIEGFDADAIVDEAPGSAYFRGGGHLAVLITNDDREAADNDLAQWVEAMNKIGVEIAEYKTGAQGVQAGLSGRVGYAVRQKT